MMQTDLFIIHANENNNESQAHLDKNRPKFTRQARQVFDLLMQGKELTVLGSHVEYGVSSLPRRKKDLSDSGIKISDRWERGIKIYYMSKDDIKENLLYLSRSSL